MGKNFQSVIWNCFKQVPLSKNVICTIEKCTKKILRNDSSTKIMWDHIKYHHKETYLQKETYLDL